MNRVLRSPRPLSPKRVCFTRIARRKSSGGIEGTVKSLRGVALGVGGQAAWGVSVTGVKIRRLKSLEVIGKATGDYVLQAWYVTDATFLLGDHYWTDLDLKTQVKLKEKIGQLGLKLSDDRKSMVISGGSNLAVAVVVVRLDIETNISTRRISLVEKLPQDIGFDYSVRVLGFSHHSATRT